MNSTYCTECNSSSATEIIPAAVPPYNPIVLYLFIPFIVIPNALIIIAFATNRALRDRSNYFVVSLALGDMIIGCIQIPVLNNHLYLIYGHVIAFSTFNTLFLMCGCSYDRYVAIIHPLHYREIVQHWKVTAIIAFCWVFPLIWMALPKIWYDRENYQLLTVHRVYIGIFGFTFIILTILQLISYIHVFVVARKHYNSMKALAKLSNQVNNTGRRMTIKFRSLLRELRLAKMFALISFLFFFFWIPMGYINIVDDVFLKPELMPDWMFKTSFYSLFFSSMINPIMYGHFQQKFRHTIRSWFRPLFRHIPCCRGTRVNVADGTLECTTGPSQYGRNGSIMPSQAGSIHASQLQNNGNRNADTVADYHAKNPSRL